MEINEIKKQFLSYYGTSDEELRVFAAPGRVNLIGEHTDYNGGFVFPAALKMQTTIVLRKRNDNKFTLSATDLDVVVSGDFDHLEGFSDLFWGNYQIGVFSELKKAGYPLFGVDMLYDDTVPHGGGLSSSAAIEVSTAFAMASLAKEQESVDRIQMALIGQRAENNYIGVSCGIMDQFASAMGKENHAIKLNCSDLSYEYAPLNLKDYKILVSNTKKKHSLADSKYNERRGECDRGFEMLKPYFPKAKCLCDISEGEFFEHMDKIPDPVIRKRVTHVICENERVKKSVEALKNDDLVLFGQLMNASHDSLRDLYEVTGEHLDTLVYEARKIDGVLGSRMTGAGFGGCTVSIIHKDSIEKYIYEVGRGYTEKTGLVAEFYISEIGDGVREIKE